MKKLLYIMLSLALIVSLAACGGAGEEGGGAQSRIESPAPTWTMVFDEATVLDMQGLAVVTYDLDLTAVHTGETMLGEYAGELAMSYSADLSGVKALLEMAGGSVSYDTDGWFKNGDFKMLLTEYSADTESAFIATMRDPDMTDEERETTNQYIAMFAPELKQPETPLEGSPVGLWYDWAFHMTEGDMSGYLTMTGMCMGTFSGSASVDESGTSATGEGYFTGIPGLVGPMHDTASYTEEAPFPYTIEVYEDGRAVFTLYSPKESPITVNFYGTVTKS